MPAACATAVVLRTLVAPEESGCSNNSMVLHDAGGGRDRSGELLPCRLDRWWEDERPLRCSHAGASAAPLAAVQRYSLHGCRRANCGARVQLRFRSQAWISFQVTIRAQGQVQGRKSSQSNVVAMERSRRWTRIRRATIWTTASSSRKTGTSIKARRRESDCHTAFLQVVCVDMAQRGPACRAQ